MRWRKTDLRRARFERDEAQFSAREREKQILRGARDDIWFGVGHDERAVLT